MNAMVRKVLRAPYEWMMTPIWRRAAVRAWEAQQDELRRDDRFDEGFYLRTYPDVAEIVGEGSYTAFEHYFAYGRTEGRLPNEDVQSEAIDAGYSHSTYEAFIEFTSRCNLKCVYCAVSQPDYKGTDLALPNIEMLVDELRKRGTKRVCVNGHGETTILKEWATWVGALVDAGFEVHMIGNFARQYKQHEIELFARYHSIQVSLDTMDAELLGQLRRGARLHVILENMKRIREAAGDGPGPQMSISCVVTDKNVEGIPELVDSLMERGIREFRFCDLVKYPDIPGAIAVRHVSFLDPDRMRAVRAGFNAAIGRLEAGGGWYWVEPSLEPFLLGAAESPGVSAATAASAIGAKESFHSEIPAGMTRDCLDPWSFLYLHATGEIRPCCMLEETYTDLGQGPPDEILNNDKFRALRKRLLSGELDDACGNCRARPITTTERLRERVKAAAVTRRARPEL
jgi:MoaA/NifB/PqqE/SkfB family radical SAM enzyme